MHIRIYYMKCSAHRHKLCAWNEHDVSIECAQDARPNWQTLDFTFIKYGSAARSTHFVTKWHDITSAERKLSPKKHTPRRRQTNCPHLYLNMIWMHAQGVGTDQLVSSFCRQFTCYFFIFFFTFNFDLPVCASPQTPQQPTNAFVCVCAETYF